MAYGVIEDGFHIRKMRCDEVLLKGDTEQLLCILTFYANHQIGQRNYICVWRK